MCWSMLMNSLFQGIMVLQFRISKSIRIHAFHMKDLSIMKYFLGIKVARSPIGILLCKRKYALDITINSSLLQDLNFPTTYICLHSLCRGRSKSNGMQHYVLCVVLKGNLSQGILLRADYDLQLYAWCNSKWVVF